MATFIKSKSSSNSSTGVGYSNGVFLSFRREDTCKNFTDHLCYALVQAGIPTFRDVNELTRGEEISQQLKAIEESRISIVVFSKGYASSTKCLDELAKIMECKNTIGQIVVPVFYDIEPSDIRKQKRSFLEAFKAYEEICKVKMKKVNKWRGALNEASNLFGYALKDMANRHESIFIQNIVEDVSIKLNRKYFHVTTHLVGVDSRVDNMLSWLRTETNFVRIVGIHGMPGIGKTTTAKIVFNQLCNGFEGSCFLKNIAEKSQQSNGVVQLQEELLCEILKRDSWKINNEDEGIRFIKERLYHKRILVVLDDVEQQKQIDALVGEGSLFGVGSIIIITTKNEHLLNRFKVVVKYQAELLNQDESIQLFNWHAFRDTCPPKDYVELSNKIVDYSGGLPLALEVLGSCLYKKDKIRWEYAIDKLRKIPKHDIQEKLRISFDLLDDDKLQNAFLDIACFFIGREKENVAAVLEARGGFKPEHDLGTLIERSLITINGSGEINMHDLLRDMGREVIREMSPKHPGKCNRIWHHDDAWNVLIKEMGTEAVEGLALALDVRKSEVEPLSTKSFTEMKRLQLLKIDGVHLIGSFKALPKGVIWLCWHGCPLQSLPSNFELSNLVSLDMQYSNIKELWKNTKILNKLKILNLSYCKNLAKLPNFEGLSNLERLILKYCTSLVEVPQSIGHLKMLVYLNLKGCYRLKILSKSICDVKSLETLIASGCSNLEELRGYSFNQDSLLSTAWPSLISSCHLPRGSNGNALLPTSLVRWNLLRELNLGYCGFSEGATISVDFGSLSSLEILDLSGNKFLNLPSGIDCLPRLQVLRVRNCIALLLMSKLPARLVARFANGCTSMQRVRLPIQSKSVPFLCVAGCTNSMEMEGKCLKIDSNDSSRLSTNDMSLVKVWSNNYYVSEIYLRKVRYVRKGEMAMEEYCGEELEVYLEPGNENCKVRG